MRQFTRAEIHDRLRAVLAEGRPDTSRGETAADR
jgi:hypothetical protein